MNGTPREVTTDTTKQKNGKLNLSDLTSEEIAKQLLETPSPPEKQEAKEKARARKGERPEEH